jgi:hypothetical protein
MRAAILAAGVGRRLSDPDLPPKVLLSFDGETLLARHLRLLRRRGITRVDLAVGFRAEAIAREVDRLGAGHMVTSHFNPDYERGAMVSLWTLREAVESGEPVIFMDGDVLYDHRMLDRLVASPHGDCHLLDRDNRLLPLQPPDRATDRGGRGPQDPGRGARRDLRAGVSRGALGRAGRHLSGGGRDRPALGGDRFPRRPGKGPAGDLAPAGRPAAQR